MKDDMNASEKRLIAALDRIDAFIDRAPGPEGYSEAQADDGDLRAESRRLSEELAELQDRQVRISADYEARLASANERLNAAGDEIARLATANDALIAANHQLVSADIVGADQLRTSLEAEIKALRAARAAEVGQMDDIIGSLDRMLGKSGVAPTPRATAETPVPDLQEPEPQEPDLQVTATETVLDERD